MLAYSSSSGGDPIIRKRKHLVTNKTTKTQLLYLVLFGISQRLPSFFFLQLFRIWFAFAL